MLGRLRAGVLDLDEVYRFPNEPVREHGSLHWDMLRLWLEMQRGLERVAATARGSRASASTPGAATTALLGEPATCSGNPYHYRDSRTDGVMDAVFAARAARADLRRHRHPVPAFNTLYQLYAACRATPRLIDAAAQFGTIPDLLNYWLTGELRAEYTQGDDDADGRCADADLGDRAAARARHPDAAAAAAGRAGHGARPRCSASVCARARRHAGRRARVPRHRIRGRVGARRRQPRVPQLRHLVAARHRDRARRSSRRARAS